MNDPETEAPAIDNTESLNERLRAHTIPQLMCLLGCDWNAAIKRPVTWQTYTDARPKPDPDPLAHTFYGSLEIYAERLENLNRKGAGVFVSINETKGKPRTAENTVRIRGYHADIDSPKAKAGHSPNTCLPPIPPTMEVQTVNGTHPYFLLREPEDCTDAGRRDQHKAELKAIQRGLADYGADPGASTVERVLRVAGFYHCKGTPELVKLVKTDGPRYTRQEVRQAFGMGPIDETPPETTSEPANPVNKEPQTLPAKVDPKRAESRAVHYLTKTAPLAVEGQAGDTTTFLVAARLKDFGCTRDQALFLMDLYWNPRCDPPWDWNELSVKVANAFDYGKDAPGVSAPEAQFDAVEPEDDGEENNHPFDVLNREYAFIRKGAFVAWETTDARGRYCVDHLSVDEFHAWHANQPFQQSNAKPRPISKCWLESPKRRQYDGITFAPLQDPGPRWLNLWRGFTVEPADTPHPENHPAVAAFLEHARDNVCGGNAAHFRWLIGFFAHLIQRPWEKPLVALVMRGKKGTGKNALVERVGHLLGPHFLVADDPRYLLSNFNSHLENCLFEVLDEAAWAGNPKDEGKLKGLITGTYHNIERKNREPYQVPNLTRVAILGNEKWLVPATQEERRFAVFTVNDGRLQDRAFFIGMRKGMEAGGYAHLLRFLQDFDLSTVDINQAPRTQGLADQKLLSLKGTDAYLFETLMSGQVDGTLWTQKGLEISKDRLYADYCRKSRDRRWSYKPEDVSNFFKRIRGIFRHAKGTKPRVEGTQVPHIRLPALQDARQDFEREIGDTIPWDVE